MIAAISSFGNQNYVTGDFEESFFLAYLDPTTNDIAKITFPCTKLPSSFIDGAKYATFGMGRKEVTDMTYRSAKIFAKGFLTNLEMQSRLRDTVAKFISQTAFKIELDKLNMYVEGDFFKAHQDTPEDNLIATVVVCLPMPFTGGDLIIDGEAVSWFKDSASKIQYVVFYPELTHEVKRVTSGTRLTLTYSVRSTVKSESLSEIDSEKKSSESEDSDDYEKSDYSEESDESKVSVKEVSKVEVLVNPPEITPPPEATTIGYFCQHSYTSNRIDLLKGVDASFNKLALEQGFKTAMVPITVCDSTEVKWISKPIKFNAFGHISTETPKYKNEFPEQIYCITCKKPTFYHVFYKSEPWKVMCPNCMTSSDDPEIIIRSPYFVYDTTDVDPDICHEADDGKGFAIEVNKTIRVNMWINTFRCDNLKRFSKGRFYYGNYPLSKDYAYGSYALIAYTDSKTKFTGEAHDDSDDDYQSEKKIKSPTQPTKVKPDTMTWCIKELFGSKSSLVLAKSISSYTDLEVNTLVESTDEWDISEVNSGGGYSMELTSYMDKENKKIFDAWIKNNIWGNKEDHKRATITSYYKDHQRIRNIMEKKIFKGGELLDFTIGNQLVYFVQIDSKSKEKYQQCLDAGIKINFYSSGYNSSGYNFYSGGNSETKSFTSQESD